MPLSHDLKQAAGAVRLMQDAPAIDLRANLSSIAELLDRASHEAASLEFHAPHRARRARQLVSDCTAVLERAAIRVTNAARRGSAPPREVA